MAEPAAGVCKTGPVTNPQPGAGDGTARRPAAPGTPAGSADPAASAGSGESAEVGDTVETDETAETDDVESSDGVAGTESTAGAVTGAAGGAMEPAVPACRTWRRVLLLAGIAVAVLVIDAVTKALIVASIAEGENVRILGGLVYLTQIRNPGAAFSMATGMTWVLAIVAIAVVAFIIRMAPRLHSTPWAVCLGLILGGALGNLSDRVFRAPGFLQGHVVDFISVFGPNAEYFPAFNAADSAISIGGVMLVLIALLGYDFDGRRHRGARRAAAPPGTPSGQRADTQAGVVPTPDGDRGIDR